jgi:hypothetical protein
MKIEIVTPAGRQRYLELLFLHLKSQKVDFDQWTLWLNTTNRSDIEFCKKLERENEWIKTIDLDIHCSGNGSISSFFKHAKDPDTVLNSLSVAYVLPKLFTDKTKESILPAKDPEFITPFCKLVLVVEAKELDTDIKSASVAYILFKLLIVVLILSILPANDPELCLLF